MSSKKEKIWIRGQNCEEIIVGDNDISVDILSNNKPTINGSRILTIEDLETIQDVLDIDLSKFIVNGTNTPLNILSSAINISSSVLDLGASILRVNGKVIASVNSQGVLEFDNEFIKSLKDKLK